MKQIEFYGDKLDVVDMEDGKPGIVARRLVENLGLSWSSQSEKLADPHFKCSVIGTVGEDGRNREMLVLPVQRLNAYLYGINANKVRGDLQEKIRLYQDECADVLYNYWAKGYAVNPRVSIEDNMMSFYHTSGELASDFLQNMLDHTAETKAQNEIISRVIGHILTEALRADALDLHKNILVREGKERYLNRTEMAVISVLELEIGAWIGRNRKLPQSELEVMNMVKDVSMLADNMVTDARFILRSYTERFDKPLSCFLEKL
jgi:P22_AR N-terminal domain.